MHQREHGEFIKEAGIILSQKFGTVILDEAHKARAKGGFGEKAAQPNNLLCFMQQMGRRTRHMILGTATPIQTDVRELWDLLDVLNCGADFVLGDSQSAWKNHEQGIPMATGKIRVTSEEQAWIWLNNPLPPASDHPVIQNIREMQGISSDTFYCSHDFENLDYMVKSIWLSQCLDPEFFKSNNPILRHTVLRKRKQLEEDGLLEKVGVNIHPNRINPGQYQHRFIDFGIPTNTPFEVAYEQAEKFSQLLQKRTKAGGFMKSLMLQRICSSFASVLSTLPEKCSSTQFQMKMKIMLTRLNIFCRTCHLRKVPV